MEKTFKDFVAERFKGTLFAGAHHPDGAACVLEAASIWQNLEWTDKPDRLHIWDIRPINDIPVDPELRAEWIVPLYEAYIECVTWPREKQSRIAAEIAIQTVRQIVAELPELPEHIRQQCRACSTLEEARAAAWAATDTAWAATRAARAARAAAWAATATATATATAGAAAAARAAGAAADAAGCIAVFVKAIGIWIDAAKDQKEA